MSVITNDGHSFLIQGRRIWLVSGTIHYARVPHQLWEDRLRAAKQAGLNCIETPVVWAAHEPQSKRISFDAQNDIAAFIKIAINLGLYVVVRLGPAIGDGYDLGGLPAWLIPETAGNLRTADTTFMNRSATWLSALCQQIAPLQITKRRKDETAGILLVQSEHKWFYNDDQLAQAYLAELIRYLREGGITVPIINRNNLFQSVEGEIDTWAGRDDLHATVRQLRTAAPANPRLVMGYQMGNPPTWDEPTTERTHPKTALRGAAEILAAGGQFNLTPFHAGTMLGWLGGRLETAEDAFCATGWNRGVPLGERGERAEMYAAIKRITTFASAFERVLAALDPDYHPVAAAPQTLDPDPERLDKRPRTKADDHAPLAVVHAKGALGSIVWLFADPTAAAVQRSSIVMPSGATLPVIVGPQGVAWILLDTHLHGRSTLDFCTLNAFASVGKAFACYGPAGEAGLLSINGSAIETPVPSNKSPNIIQHEGITAIICSEEQIDHAYATDEGIWIGIDGFDKDDKPIAPKGSRKAWFVDREGNIQETMLEKAPTLTPARAKIDIKRWQYADTIDNVAGTSQRFASIDGSSPMEALGVPNGYGWLRLTFKSGAAKRIKAAFPQAADRLHLNLDATPIAIVGQGPGATLEHITLPLKKKEHNLTILVDNLGRTASGLAIGESKGLFGPIHEAKPIKAEPQSITEGPPIDVADIKSPFFGHAKGETTSPKRATVIVQHRKKCPLIVTVENVHLPAALLCNDTVIAPIAPAGTKRFVLDPEQHLNRGNNTIQIAIVAAGTAVDNALKEIKINIHESASIISDKAKWAFAKWECPDEQAFNEIPKSKLAGKAAAAFANRPAWWRLEFETTHDDAPLLLETEGLSKGVIFLNDHNCGRYWAATADATPVGPQSRYYLPEPWIHTDQPNTLTIFDEHGFTPDKVKLTYDI